MFLRQLRWIAAGVAVVAALGFAPARAKADVQILVEEYAGNSRVAFQYTTGTGTVVPFAFNGNYFSGGGSVTTVNGAAASLSPSFSGLFNPGAIPQDHTLKITVTNDGFTTGGVGQFLNNDSGASQAGFTGGQITVSTSSSIYNPLAAGSTPASSSSVLAGGTTLFGPTPSSTTVGGGNGPTTTASVGSLPTPYAIQQEILISFSGSPNAGGTFTAGGGARVESVTPNQPAAVPAPASLALALIGLPLVGLRRTLRKRAAA